MRKKLSWFRGNFYLTSPHGMPITVEELVANYNEMVEELRKKNEVQ